MNMSFFLSGIISAFIVVALVSVPALIASSKKGRVLAVASQTFVGLALVNWFLYWLALPIAGFSWLAYSQTWMWWVIELAIVAAIVYLLCGDSFKGWLLPGTVVAAIVVMLLQGIFNAKAWFPGDGDALVQQTKVTMVNETGQYPETDADHMVVVPIEVARQTMDRAMGSDVATYYNAGEPALQSISGHAYWVSVLEPDWLINNNAKQGLSPGFVVVDAESPNVAPRYVDKNADGSPMVIRYQPNGWFDNKLARHVRSSGFADVDLEDWTLELDDAWRPFWTASSNKLPSAAFTQTLPQETIVVDAQTGDIQRYTLDKTPNWIDRIYSASAVKHMLNWWGEWGTAGFAAVYFNSGDRYTTAKDQEPTLVYTKSGHPEWQVQLSASNNDQTAMFVALFSGRTNTAKIYKIPNLPLEAKAIEVALNSNQNTKKNQPSHIALHKIYGQLTWVMPLIDPAEGDKDAAKSSFQGLALMKAEGANGSELVMDPDISTALAKYRNNVLKSGNVKPEEDSTLATVEGTVSHLSPPMVEGGQNVFYFRLQGASRTFKMTVDPNDAEQSTERPFIKVGAKVAITYRDSGDNKGDVVKYDDLGMQ